MASIYDDIRGALEKTLADTSGLPTDIAWENVNFVPTTGTAYMQTQLVPTTRTPAVRGLNPQMRYDGFFNIFIHVPEGGGPFLADDYADLVIDAFEATTDISFAGDTSIILSIDYAQRRLGIHETPFYYTQVEVAWYIYK